MILCLFALILYVKLEWQVFRNTENIEKSRKMSTKQQQQQKNTQKIVENNVF